MEALRLDDPRRVGPYVLLARLGAGGMGVVYLGRSPGGRAVAVKVIRDRFAGDVGFMARFRREVAAARMVAGAFTAPVLDADPDDADGPWLVTAYLPGVTLREAVRAAGALRSGAVWTLAAGLAEALVDIHRVGVVHRDLKPGNVMLGGDGPRVIDFGIARPDDATAITRLGAVLGSPGYMSPEQVAGATAGPASDVFSFGAVLVFAATAREPFGAGATEDVLGRVARVEVDLDDVGDRELRALISSCLVAEPARRPAAVELLERMGDRPGHAELLPPSLAALAEHRAAQAKYLPDAPAGRPAHNDPTLDPELPSEPVDTHPLPTRPIEVPAVSRRRLVLGGGVLAAGAVGGGVLFAWSRRRPAVQGEPRAAATTTTSQAAPGSVPTRVWRQRVSTSPVELILTGGVLLGCGRDRGIRALEPGTGQLLWSRDEESVEATAGELVFLVNPKGWLLSAVDVRTGAVRWTFTPETGFRSTPVAVVGSVVWCNSNSMTALALADGRELAAAGAWNGWLVTTNGLLVAVWTDRIGGHDPNTGDHTWMDYVTEPTDVQAASGLVFYCDRAGTVFAIRADDGAAVWQRTGLGSTFQSWFQVVGDTAYCSVDGAVLAMDVATGQTRWTRSLGRRTGTTDPYANTKKCVIGAIGATLYAGDVDGTMYAVDAVDGRVRWTHRTAHRVTACPVGTDDLVFLATRDGFVEAITPPKGR